MQFQNSLFSLHQCSGSLNSYNSSESLTPMTPHSLSQTSLTPMKRYDMKDPRNQMGLIQRLKEIQE
jgi:hypothetical protein